MGSRKLRCGARRSNRIVRYSMLCGVLMALALTSPNLALATVEDNPAAFAAGPGEVTAFARGDNGRLHQRLWQPTTNAWTEWIDLGGMQMESGPSVDRRADGTTDLFALGAGNRVYHRYYTAGSRWSNWAPLSGGCLASAPASAPRSGTSYIDVLARGCDNQLQINTYTSSWSGWAPLGGQILYSPAVISRPDGPINVFVVGTDHQLYQKTWTGSTWTGFLPLGGYLTSAPTVVSRSPGKYDVFARDASNNIAQRSWDGIAWSGWGTLPTVATSAPSAFAEDAGRLGLVVRGGSQLYINQFANASWSGWGAFGVVATPAPITTGMAIDTRVTVLNVFDHPWYATLGQSRLRVRVIADWDAALASPTHADELARVAGIVSAAQSQGAEIMLTLRNRRLQADGGTPDRADYLRGVQALYAVFGTAIRYWGVLNEPNLAWPDVTDARAEKLASYYSALVGYVGASKVVGPDFFDVNTWTGTGLQSSATVTSRLSDWVSAYRQKGGGFGVAATLHPYGAISRMNPASVVAYLSALPSNTPVWLTEAGATRQTHGNLTYVDGVPVDDSAQDRQVQYLLQVLSGLRTGTRSVQRIYYYSFIGSSTWDSGLVDGYGIPRPSWYTFCAYSFSTSCS